MCGAESIDVIISDTINVADIIVEDGYEGLQMDTDDAEQDVVTERFVKDMMEAFKDQKRLHRRYVLVILLAFQRLVKELPSLVDIEVCFVPGSEREWMSVLRLLEIVRFVFR